MRIKIKEKKTSVLALSGFQKASWCFAGDREAFISEESWDLSTPAGREGFKSSVSETENLFGRPAFIAHDFHPDFYSTKLTHELAEEWEIPSISIRHHHAHITAVAGEHQFSEPLLGLALDGFGLGENNELWGGELLKVTDKGYQRLGRLKPQLQPGGDLSVRNPELLAAAFLYRHQNKDKDRNETLIHFPNLPAVFWEGLAKRINCPQTSSCGRLFDLACELLKIKEKTQIETLLHFENLASNPRSLNPCFKIEESEGIKNLDLDLLLLSLQSYNTSEASDIFHGTLAAGLAEMSKAAADETGLHTIALSGGCIFNKVLRRELTSRLQEKGFTVLTPKLLSPGDESISFGMAVAATTPPL